MRLASASRDGSIKMWDLKDDGNMYKTLKGDSKWLYACSWSPDAKMLASVGDSRSVSCVFDTVLYILPSMVSVIIIASYNCMVKDKIFRIRIVD